MRSLIPIALLGSFLLVTSAPAQSLAEHAAAASGATIGTAAGKPLSNAISTIFGKADSTTKKASNSGAYTKTPAKSAPAASAPALPAPAGGPETSPVSEPAPARHGGFAKRPAVAEYPSPIAQPVVEMPEPPRKEPTAEELASIQVGVSEQDLFTALGEPESKVSIPDDDGHLLVICQYWAKGRQLGTVRLDNGQVISVARTQN